MPDEGVVTCVLSRLKRLRFPRPEAGHLTFVYPMQFEVEPPNAAAVLTSGPYRECSFAEGLSDKQGGARAETPMRQPNAHRDRHPRCREREVRGAATAPLRGLLHRGDAPEPERARVERQSELGHGGS